MLLFRIKVWVSGPKEKLEIRRLDLTTRGANGGPQSEINARCTSGPRVFFWPAVGVSCLFVFLTLVVCQVSCSKDEEEGIKGTYVLKNGPCSDSELLFILLLKNTLSVVLFWGE